jgi:hypothetical protein
VENDENSQSKLPVAGLRFEPGTDRDANHKANLLIEMVSNPLLNNWKRVLVPIE